MPRHSTFVDQAKVRVKSGRGGDGHVGFRREKYVPRGGPDGGDGGHGGDVVFIGSSQLATLLDFHYRKHFRAKDGAAGGKNQRTGADGASLEIEVPLGTLIKKEDDTLVGEIVRAGDRLIVAKGGKGGLGNRHFVSSTNRAPRRTTPGREGEEYWIQLELQVLADIGIVGPPNAGKSTLLSVLTAARPKIAAYPFTTLDPGLGVMEAPRGVITLADIPGLIEGAHQGAGLGVEFLRHVRRTRALLFVVAASDELEGAWNDFVLTREEILKYDVSLDKRPAVVVINKIDLFDPAVLAKHRQYFIDREIDALLISAKNKIGLEPLREKLGALIH